MKKALIMGITGGFGRHVAESLLINGWQLKALMRTPDKLPNQFKEIDVIKGDAGNLSDVAKAAKDVDVIIYGVNPANYDWGESVFSMLDNVASVAEQHHLTVVFPGNVYVFNPSNGPVFSETSVHDPITSKGAFRVKMEDRLKVAADNGAQVLLIRMGDFIGRGANSTWLKQIIKNTKKGYTLSVTGPTALKHTWANLPDVASTVSSLLDKRAEMDSFNEFNFKGYQASFDDIVKAIEKSRHTTVVIKRFPWFLLKILSPFSALFRGLVEMKYLWDYAINLDERKLSSTLDGKIQHTQLPQALLDSGLLDSSVIGKSVTKPGAKIVSS